MGTISIHLHNHVPFVLDDKEYLLVFYQRFLPVYNPWHLLVVSEYHNMCKSMSHNSGFIKQMSSPIPDSGNWPL